MRQVKSLSDFFHFNQIIINKQGFLRTGSAFVLPLPAKLVIGIVLGATSLNLLDAFVAKGMRLNVSSFPIVEPLDEQVEQDE